ncbi:MAG: prepilin-type N-terminal cleavage/methylation domain-containing protein [Planctomycetota bacterium]|nr:prepilin-type N-terminal cleavage/methylation domain-containing protein [Planctomycetota bacterium]
MSASARPRARGFTLIEMLVVIAIVTILGGLVLTALATARKRAAIQRQESLLNTLEKACIERYATDFNEYPASNGNDGVLGGEQLLKALMTKDKDGPYLKLKEFKTLDTNNNGNEELVDEWYHPLRYVHFRDYGREPPNKNSFRLWSVGPDGIDDPLNPDGDDVVNWKKGKEDHE